MLSLSRAAILLLTLTAPCAAQPKLALSSHGSTATVVSIKGADTDKAVVTLRIELDDAVEYCIRGYQSDKGESATSDEIAKCTKESMQDRRPIAVRRAFCSRSTVYLEFGNFSLVGQEIDKEPGSRVLRTKWMNHRTGEEATNDSVGQTAIILSTFEVLCPAQYAKVFGGYDPY